mmetsp:Transcript_90767/g.293012  ORF Transcript_90767/g.293012 Transcript_90767/m.293012 type:complete len:931 (+) Transcript_90767:127-2919(+)
MLQKSKSQAVLERSTASRIGWAAITAIPVTLMVLGGCVSYAQLLVQGTPLDVNVLVACFNFSVGIAMITKNLASYNPYTLSSSDMTLQLFLKQVLTSVAAASIAGQWSQQETVATMWVALHLASLFIGVIFALLGHFRAAVALSYLPYPVIAGFLAMVGAAIMKGAVLLLLPKDGESSLPLVFGIALAGSSTVAKAAGMPGNLASVLAIVLSIISFWTWVYWSGRDTTSLRQDGWLFPQEAEAVAPFAIWSTVEWQHVSWMHVMPDSSSLMLALVACINRALTITGIEAAVGDSSYSIDDEMRATGLATSVAGLVGGISMNPSSGMSSLCKEGCEGDTRMAFYAAIISTTSFICLWVAGVPLTNYLPRFMLGGLLMMNGVGMVVDWAWYVRRRIQPQSLVMIYLMLAFSLYKNLISGVMLGLLIALVLTNARFARLEVLKYHVSGMHFRSSMVYSPVQRNILAKNGDRTQVVGLTGFLFEGVAIYLSKYLREVVRGSEELETLVLDFFACQGLNDSACAHLVKVNRLCASDGVTLRFVNLHPEDMALLKSWSIKEFPESMGTALGEAERAILADFNEPVEAPLGRSTDDSTELAALAKWLGEDVADVLLEVGKLQSVTSGTNLSQDTKGPNRDIIVAIPGHSEVCLEARTGNRLRPAVLFRSMSGAVCGGEALIGQASKGVWRALSDSVVLVLPSAESLEASPTAIAALLGAAFHQQVHQTDQLSSLYTVNRGGGWQGVTFDGMTMGGGAKETMEMLGKEARDVPMKKKSKKEKFMNGFQPMPHDENHVGEHLVAAVLERRDSLSVMSPILKGSSVRSLTSNSEDDCMILNRLSINEGQKNKMMGFMKSGRRQTNIMELFGMQDEDAEQPNDKPSCCIGGADIPEMIPESAEEAEGRRPTLSRRMSNLMESGFGKGLLTSEWHPLDGTSQ